MKLKSRQINNYFTLENYKLYTVFGNLVNFEEIKPKKFYLTNLQYKCKSIDLNFYLRTSD